MSTELTNNELHEGDTVRIVKGTKHWHKTGTIEHIGHSTGLPVDVVPLYIVRLKNIGPLVFLRDELERITPEESRGVV